MTKKAAALFSTFVVDGVQQEFTPAQLLDAVSPAPSASGKQHPGEGCFVDETVDPDLKALSLDATRVETYLDSVLKTAKRAPFAGTDSYIRGKIDTALIDAIWNKGHFHLGNLCVDARWKWNESPVGAMAAFYNSVKAAADHLDALGVKLSNYRYQKTAGPCKAETIATIPSDPAGADDDFILEPYCCEKPQFSRRRAVPATIQGDPQSWIVFVPFDTSDFCLGASLLSQIYGLGGAAPDLSDSDYFIDCYEVVRELVEDNIIIAGATVGEGGLLKAVKEMSASDNGLMVDISDLMRSYQEKNVLRVLFSEIPGVILQIKDADFDYLDVELLLQDVAYFPLGHPRPGKPEIEVKASAKSGIQTILESLLQNAEGED